MLEFYVLLWHTRDEHNDTLLWHARHAQVLLGTSQDLVELQTEPNTNVFLKETKKVINFSSWILGFIIVDC